MSYVDLRSLPAGTNIEADVCIIGAGPAGLAIANDLNDAGIDVVVLESGGLEFEASTQDLAAGMSIGVPYPPLIGTRLRYFGGTSNHWGGNVRMLDPQDFLQREWIPNSGWPFTLETLLPYYTRAAEFCGFPETAFDASYWAQVKVAEPWRFIDDKVVSNVFHTVAAPHLRFGQSYRTVFSRSARIRVFLNANVVSIESEESGTAVSRLLVKTLNGSSHSASARLYVLATGGIENARLLLLSPNVNEGVLGNGGGLVGRCFMEHLTVPEFCRFYPADPSLPLGFYRSITEQWGDTWGVLSLSQRRQQEAGVANFRFQLTNITNRFNEHMSQEGLQSLRALVNRQQDLDEFGRHAANIIADIDEVASLAYQYLVNRPDYPLVHVDVVAIGEQVPNRESRVLLGEDLDAFRQQRSVLDWKLTEQDSGSIRRSAAELARALGESGLGRLEERFPPDVFNEVQPRPHIHHMGTTRMHENPADGVVNPDCRVHGVDNLYVAGSSIFPTVGNVNPTYTILALAIRLADHLKETLSA